DVLDIHMALSLAKCHHQRLVTEDIDQARNPLCRFVQQVKRPTTEHGVTVVSRSSETMTDVTLYAIAVERFEPVGERDALQQLAQGFLLQHFIELRLCKEDHLEQLR